MVKRSGSICLAHHEAPLWLAICRLVMEDQQQICVSARYCPTVELHNCEAYERWKKTPAYQQWLKEMTNRSPVVQLISSNQSS
jgi:hypothetical protein